MLMKRYTLYLFLPLITLMLFGCQYNEEGYEELLVPLYTPEYAKGFTIYGIEGQESTLIRVSNPWEGAKGVVMDTFVARSGEKPPRGFEGQVVEADAQRLVTLSTTHIGMLEYLGEERRIVGVSGLQYVFNEYLTDPRNGVKDVGMPIQYETLVGLQPDLLFCYGVSDAEQMMTDKLEELQIPYIYVAAYLEHTALGKSEWLVLFAELLDLREEGIKGFEQIETNYREALALTADIPQEERPVVMLNMPFNDAWVLPAEESVTASLMRDAGAVPQTGDKVAGDVSYIGMEEAVTRLSQSQYWVGLGQMTTRFSDLPEALRQHAMETPPVQQGHLYNNNALMTEGGGSAYYQEGTVRPDLILRDLIEIFHPELQEHQLHFYRPIPIE